MPPVRGIGSSRYTTQNQGGGNKKQGLPPSVGLGHFSFRIIRRKAGGYLRNSNNSNNSNTCQSEFIFLTGEFTGTLPDANVIVFLEGLDVDNSFLTNKINNTSIIGLQFNSNTCNFSFIVGSNYTITITQGQNINKVTGIFYAEDGSEDNDNIIIRYFGVIDVENISGGAVYENNVPALVTINNNAINRWCQAGYKLLMSPENYVISQVGPAVLFVKSIDNINGTVEYTTDVAESNYIQLGVFPLASCNNLPISDIIQNKITSLTISQGNNKHKISITYNENVPLNDSLFQDYVVEKIDIINGDGVYSVNDPITITFTS